MHRLKVKDGKRYAMQKEKKTEVNSYVSIRKKTLR